MPTYEHTCELCAHEWEQDYSMSDPVPTTCPGCNKPGGVKRLISWSAGKVELSGKDNVKKLWAEGKAIARDANKKENLLANLVGEDKYQANVSNKRNK